MLSRVTSLRKLPNCKIVWVSYHCFGP